MNIETLLNIKNHPDCLILDEDRLNIIKSILNVTNFKKKKNNKNVNITKKPNFLLKKNKIDNKIIYILNKLSESNINDLLVEFIKNININDINDYNIILEKIYYKLLEDSSFIQYYTLYLINIIKIIYKKYQYKPDHLINLIDITITDTYNKFNNNDETKRINFIIFINELIKNNFFNQMFIDYFSNLLVSQNKYIIDIKKWFSFYDINNYVDKLKNIKIDDLRNKLIFESIFDKNQSSNNNDNPIKQVENIKTVNLETEFDNECENIIEEYMYLKLNEEILYFIKNNCTTKEKKNKFIQKIKKKHMETADNNLNNLLKIIN